MNISKIGKSLGAVLCQTITTSKKAAPSAAKKAAQITDASKIATLKTMEDFAAIDTTRTFQCINDKGIEVKATEILDGLFCEPNGEGFSGYISKIGQNGNRITERYQDGSLRTSFDGFYHKIFTNTYNGKQIEAYDIKGNAVNSLFIYKGVNPERCLTTYLPQDAFKKHYHLKDTKNGLIHNVIETWRNGEQRTTTNIIKDLEGNILQKGKEKAVRYFKPQGQLLLEITQDNPKQRHYVFPNRTGEFNLYPIFKNMDLEKNGFIIIEDMGNGISKFISNTAMQEQGYISTGLKKGDNSLVFTPYRDDLNIRGYEGSKLQFETSLFALPMKNILKLEEAQGATKKGLRRQIYEFWKNSIPTLNNKDTETLKRNVTECIDSCDDIYGINEKLNFMTQKTEGLSKNNFRFILDMIKQ